MHLFLQFFLCNLLCFLLALLTLFFYILILILRICIFFATFRVSSIMKDKERVYLQEWKIFCSIREIWRYQMLRNATKFFDVKDFYTKQARLLNLNDDNDYKIALKINVYDSAIIDVRCCLCGFLYPKFGFIGQFHFLCDTCIWRVFQDSSLSVVQKIANLAQFNVKCVDHAQKMTPDKAKRYYMWLCRMKFLRAKFDFYTKNQHVPSRRKYNLDANFGLPVFEFDSS